MGPTSLLLAAVFLVIAVLVPVALALLWWWARDPQRPVRRGWWSLGVVAFVLVGQVAVVGASGVWLNRTLGLYPTWGDVGALVEGGDDLEAAIPNNEPVRITPEQAQLIERQGWAPFRIQPPNGDGQYRLYLVAGPSNHTQQPVVVWVPPGYEKAKRLDKLKVVYLYNAAYGSVDWFFGAMRPGSSAAPLVRSKKLPPFAIVAPEINIDAPGDTECTDYPNHGPQAFTWLTKDVPAWAHSHLGLATGAVNASAIGWSVGGYCAAKVHAAEPQVFGAAVSAQGFFRVEADRTTGALADDLARYPGLRQRTDVGWLLRTRPRTGKPHLLVLSSKADPQSFTGSHEFLERYGSMPGIYPAVAERSGHSVQAWRHLQPELWRFLVLRTHWPKGLT